MWCRPNDGELTAKLDASAKLAQSLRVTSASQLSSEVPQGKKRSRRRSSDSALGPFPEVDFIKEGLLAQHRPDKSPRSTKPHLHSSDPLPRSFWDRQAGSSKDGVDCWSTSGSDSSSHRAHHGRKKPRPRKLLRKARVSLHPAWQSCLHPCLPTGNFAWLPWGRGCPVTQLHEMCIWTGTGSRGNQHMSVYTCTWLVRLGS